MGINIIQKVELKNFSACLLKRAFMINVHHHGDGSTLQTDKLWDELHNMLMAFQDLFGKPTIGISQSGMLTHLEIEIEPKGKIPSYSPWRVSLREEAELWRQIGELIH
jgi:hypothetical protein